MELAALGWDERWEAGFAAHRRDGCLPGRVGLEHQHIYRLYLEDGEPLGQVSGRLRHRALVREDFPAVGDWVAVKPAADPGRVVIHAVLPRRSRFTRKVAGTTTEAQVVAANVDTLFLVAGLDGEFNVRRLERYLVTAEESGARPVIVLNKADTADDVAARVVEVLAIAPRTPIHPVSCRTGEGFEQLCSYLEPRQTVALLGSSGVGKSTIINRFLGFERQATNEVRASDQRGRHTTTNRELIVLPSGALLIDTPGMRELQLWEATALDDSFDDIGRAAEDCRFRDCRHETEPDCAVRAAVDAGAIAAERLDSYIRLRREREALERRQDQLAMIEDKKKLRTIHKPLRNFKPRG